MGSRAAQRSSRRRRLGDGLVINGINAAFNLLLWGSLAAAGAVVYGVSVLPVSQSWAVPERPANIRVLASDGRLISNRGQMGGEAVSLANLPHYVAQAFIAIEDHRFYQHVGIDPVGIAAAAWDNLLARRVERGGSTITQQLAKNLFLSRDQTFARKLDEAVLALRLERRYSKTEILEMYLNRVYFGAGAHGVAAAAQRYFGKPAGALSLPEAAMLAGLVKAPSRINPLANIEAAQARSDLVLRAMAREGYLDVAADAAPSGMALEDTGQAGPSSGGYIADWVETMMQSYIGDYAGDIVVWTSIDLKLQTLAEDAIVQGITAGGDTRHFSEGALVAMTPEGAVLALVGGANYGSSQYNRAVTARRQPGSTFKTFVYLAALEKGYTADTVADDAPFIYQGWSPRNASRRFSGPVTLRYGFVHSLNTIAARLAIDVTPEKVVETAMRLGMSGPFDAVPSIALGTSEVSLLELTSAYAPFANGGLGVIASVIDRIETVDGRTLYQNPRIGPGAVINQEVAASMNDLLVASWQTISGRESSLGGLPVAGKTGTSQSGRDALFVGYTPKLVTGVWLGNDDDSGTSLSGANVPLDIWYAFMTGAHQ